METKEGQSRCPFCGKKAPRVTSYLREVTPEEYDGDLQIIRNTVEVWDDGYRCGYLTLWDGKSYKHRYEPFCTLRCAEAYAKRIYDYKKYVFYTD